MSEDATGTGEEPGKPAPRPRREARKQVLLRLDPKVYDALARWASDELRSANAQIEFLLRKSLTDAARLPKHTGPLPRRGRPPKQQPEQDRDRDRAQDPDRTQDAQDPARAQDARDPDRAQDGS